MTRSSPLPSVQYRHAAARELARRDGRALSLAQAVRPDHLAGLAVERDDRSARAAGGVENPLDRQRRPFEFVLGARAEVVGLEPPGDLELVEVRSVDLVERRVTGALHVGGVVGPVAVPGGGLARGLPREPGVKPAQSGANEHEGRCDPREPCGHVPLPSSCTVSHHTTRDDGRPASSAPSLLGRARSRNSRIHIRANQNARHSAVVMAESALQEERCAVSPEP